MVRTRMSKTKKVPGGIEVTELPCILLQANGLIIRVVEQVGEGVFWVQTLDKDYDVDKSEIRRDASGKPELASFDPKVRK